MSSAQKKYIIFLSSTWTPLGTISSSKRRKRKKKMKKKLKRDLIGVSFVTMTKCVFQMLAAMHATWIRRINSTKDTTDAFQHVPREKDLLCLRSRRRKWKKKGFKNASEALDLVRAKSTNRNRKKIKDYPQLIASYEKAKKMGLCISGV